MVGFGWFDCFSVVESLFWELVFYWYFVLLLFDYLYLFYGLYW